MRIRAWTHWFGDRGRLRQSKAAGEARMDMLGCSLAGQTAGMVRVGMQG